MRFIVLILTVFVFAKTVGYGIFEYKANNNKISAVIIYILALIALVTPNVLIYMR